jgi:hypothetical protein
VKARKLNLYSADVKIAGTVYVKARSLREATRMARAFAKGATFHFDGEDISDRSFADPALPDISLSPAFSGHGLWGPVALAEEGDGDE